MSMLIRQDAETKLTLFTVQSFGLIIGSIAATPMSVRPQLGANFDWGLVS